jgi:hypothetical protein
MKCAARRMRAVLAFSENMCKNLLLEVSHTQFTAGSITHEIYCWNYHARNLLLEVSRTQFTAGSIRHAIYCWKYQARNLLLEVSGTQSGE